MQTYALCESQVKLKRFLLVDNSNFTEFIPYKHDTKIEEILKDVYKKLRKMARGGRVGVTVMFARRCIHNLQEIISTLEKFRQIVAVPQAYVARIEWHVEQLNACIDSLKIVNKHDQIKQDE